MFRVNWTVWTCVAAAAVLPGLALAEDEFDLSVSWAFGYDSNPLRIQRDGPAAVYDELRVSLGYELDLGGHATWFLDADGRRRSHGGGAGFADTTDGALETGLAVYPLTRDRGRLGLLFGGFAEIDRSTFTDRATGLPYGIVTDDTTIPPSTAELPDRFDADTVGGYVRIFWRPAERIRLGLDVGSKRVDFLDDYRELSAIHALDHDVLRIEPEIQIQVAPRAAIVLFADLSDVDYREQPALDASGNEVPGTTRSYDYSGYGIKLKLAPIGRVRVQLGYRDITRDDLHAGYYDYASGGTFVSLDVPFGQRQRLSLYYSDRDLDYDAATVVGSVTGELRASGVRRGILRYQVRVQPHLILYAEGGDHRTSNNDPLYAYDRNWFSGGLRFRL